MTPKNIDKLAFISYETKADYILTKTNCKDYFYKIFLSVEKIAQTKNKKYTLTDYLERIYYFEYIFDENIFLKESLSSLDIFKKKLIVYIIKNKKELLKRQLFENFNICFESLKFVSIENKVHVDINNSLDIVFNYYSGTIMTNYYETILSNKEFLYHIIDAIGCIIERR